MSRIGVTFLLVAVPVLAMLLALLGVETIPTNPLGWFLLLVGVAFSAGIIITFTIRRQHFWEPSTTSETTQEERGDFSFWLIVLGMSAVFYLSPLEFLFAPDTLPRHDWIAAIGFAFVTLGSVFFVWARITLKQSYSGHLTVKAGQNLVQSVPYTIIRHPGYAGFFFIALGVGLGYSSLAGLVAAAVLLLPSLVYRIRVEEKLLINHFGEAYRQYMQTTSCLIPGIW
jgi:protein-S-isoprenylcysteine O-methyltransferase Ste14